jgi:hypothetical protein
MRRTTLSLTVGTLAFALVASTASAQDTTRKQSTGEVAPMPGFGALVAALNTSKQAVDRLKSTPAVTAANIQIVDAKPLIASGKQADFDAAVEKNRAAQTELRAELQKNETISKALADHEQKLTPNDIVAARVTESGQITLYFNKGM